MLCNFHEWNHVSRQPQILKLSGLVSSAPEWLLYPAPTVLVKLPSGKFIACTGKKGRTKQYCMLMKDGWGQRLKRDWFPNAKCTITRPCTVTPCSYPRVHTSSWWLIHTNTNTTVVIFNKDPTKKQTTKLQLQTHTTLQYPCISQMLVLEPCHFSSFHFNTMFKISALFLFQLFSTLGQWHLLGSKLIQSL